MPPTRHDESDDPLPPVLVGNANNRSLGDVGMRLEKLLDFFRCNFDSTRIDDVINAPHQVNVAVTVNKTKVSGSIPTIRCQYPLLPQSRYPNRRWRMMPRARLFLPSRHTLWHFSPALLVR